MCFAQCREMSTVVTETTEIREIAEREAGLCTRVIDTAIYRNTSPVNTKTAYAPVTDVPGSTLWLRVHTLHMALSQLSDS